MKRQRTMAMLFMLVLSGSISGLRAQSGAPSLCLLPSARAYGMGQTGVADASDPVNSHFNPGIIAAGAGVFFSASGGKLVPELAPDVYFVVASTGAAFQLISSADGIGVRMGCGIRFGYLDYGEWEARDEDNNYLGRFTSAEKYLDLTLGGEIGVAKILYFGAGLAAKPVWIDLASPEATVEKQAATGSAYAFDLGVMARVELSDFYGDARIIPSMGWGLTNLGTKIKFKNTDTAAELPSEHRVGVGVRIESPSLKEVNDMLGRRTPIGTLALEFDVIDNRLIDDDFQNLDNWGLGAELGLLQALFLRCGYVYDHLGCIEDFTFGVGLGIAFSKIWGRVDYAAVPQATELGRTHKFGLSFGMDF